VERTERTTERTPAASRRFWFRIAEVEIGWLPVGEAAFLLWVLVLLLAAWLGIGWAFGLLS
jgi:hypothetical protein